LSDQQKTRIAALDAMILTWWMRDDAPQDMKERVQWLVEELEEEKATIIVPTVALSEFLRGIQPKYHGQVIEFFRIRFVLAEFNVPAVFLLASSIPPASYSPRPARGAWRGRQDVSAANMGNHGHPDCRLQTLFALRQSGAWGSFQSG
jgi:hypothetical protein